MSSSTSILNLGVVAHVDAGKTTLTERLLFEAGVTDRIGRVDHGDTVTDADALERRRGITIRSAVVSFRIGGVKVNLIDTPGHSDFVAEVERALVVLDGAVLVVSAVEGVQAQTRVLIKTMERLQIPFLVFVNKIDRAGASLDATVAALRQALAGDLLAFTAPSDVGSSRAAVRLRRGPVFVDELLARTAEYDERMLTQYIEGTDPVPLDEARAAFDEQVAAGLLHPLYAGAALTGVGVPDVLAAIAGHLPSRASRDDATLQAGVFKLEHRGDGHPLAYVRVFDGRLRARDRVTVLRGGQPFAAGSGRVTAVEVFDRGTSTLPTSARAGDIARISGLDGVAIGDQLGHWSEDRAARVFADPGLEAVVRPRDPAQRSALFAALRRLSDEDPLIAARLDGLDEEPTVSLYGEVQKEVLTARLLDEFGLVVEFSQTRTVFTERLVGIGEASERVPTRNASVTLRVEPGPIGAGTRYRLGPAMERGYLLPNHHVAIEGTVAKALLVGPLGWQVIDATVTLVDGRFSAPTPPAGYYRGLTADAMRRALRGAGTTACAPYSDFELDAPAETLSTLLHRLVDAGATPDPPLVEAAVCRVTGTMPTAAVNGFEQRLPSLTSGLGVFVSHPAGYRAVDGPSSGFRARTAP